MGYLVLLRIIGTLQRRGLVGTAYVKGNVIEYQEAKRICLECR